MKDLTRGQLQLLAELQECFPQCFTNPPVPLAIGIEDQVTLWAAGRHSKTAIRRSLKFWCKHQLGYYESLVTGAARRDLDGSPAGEVTQAAQDHAMVRRAKLRWLPSRIFDPSAGASAREAAAENP